jgi:hypothetical protein
MERARREADQESETEICTGKAWWSKDILSEDESRIVHVEGITHETIGSSMPQIENNEDKRSSKALN